MIKKPDMQKTSTFSEIARTKTVPLHKLLFWSLVFHLLAIATLWNKPASAPLIAGKEYEGKILSVALSPSTSPANTEPVTTKEKQLQAKAGPETRYIENNSHNISASKSKMQKVVQKPSAYNNQHVATIKPEVAKEKKPREISTETFELLRASLGKKLSEYFRYPWLARKKGWQGQVKLRLRIEDSGHLSNIRLYKSSGYSSLDNAALNSLQEIAYLPDAKDWLQGMHYDIVVPVEYHLIDS